MKKTSFLLNRSSIIIGLIAIMLPTFGYAQTYTYKYKCYQSQDYYGNYSERNETTYFSFNGSLVWESEADGSEKVYDKGKYEYKLNDIYQYEGINNGKMIYRMWYQNKYNGRSPSDYDFLFITHDKREIIQRTPMVDLYYIRIQ